MGSTAGGGPGLQPSAAYLRPPTGARLRGAPTDHRQPPARGAPPFGASPCLPFPSQPSLVSRVSLSPPNSFLCSPRRGFSGTAGHCTWHSYQRDFNYSCELHYHPGRPRHPLSLSLSLPPSSFLWWGRLASGGWRAVRGRCRRPPTGRPTAAAARVALAVQRQAPLPMICDDLKFPKHL